MTKPSIDIISALAELGEMWGIGRPLTYSELARVLGLGTRDPGRTVKRWVEGYCKPPGPALVAIQMLLDGAVPPTEVDITHRGRTPKAVLAREKA